MDGWVGASFPYNLNWSGICYGGGTYVAIGQAANGISSKIMYSNDGINWTDTGTTSKTWWSVCYGGGKFVAVCGEGNMYYSTNGINWTTSASFSGQYRGVCYGGGTYVAVAYSSSGTPAARILYSSNGINWTALSIGFGYFQSVTYGNGKFVVVGIQGSNCIFYSYDGINWTNASANTTLKALKSVCYGGGKFVAVVDPSAVVPADSNKSVYSTDGVTWTVSSFESTFKPNTVFYGNNMFVALSSKTANKTVSYSSDGINWSQPSVTPPVNDWNSGCYVESATIGNYFAVGASLINGINLMKNSVTIFPPISIVTNSLPNATINTYYNQNIGITGGDGNYNISVSSGSLPTGLLISGNNIVGTPSSTGTYSFTLLVNDTSGKSNSKALSITVDYVLTFTTTSLPNATQGNTYNQAIGVTGGTGNYTFSVSSGSLPTGLSISGNSITGTPTSSGTYSFNLNVTDGVKNANKNLSIIVYAPISITTNSISDATINAVYNDSISISGGNENYSFSISSGSLPTGLSLIDNTITGTPSLSGSYTFTFRVNDTDGRSATKNFSITVGYILSFITSSFSEGNQDISYNQTIGVTGGNGNYSISVSSGSLPTGLSLINNTITGIPTILGSYPFTLRANDTSGKTATRNFSISIYTSISITTNSISYATINTSYNQAIGVTGGNGNYSFSISSGSLPTGLSLINNAITGTPLISGSYPFTFNVEDTYGRTATKKFSLTVSFNNNNIGGGGDPIIKTVHNHQFTLHSKNEIIPLYIDKQNKYSILAKTQFATPEMINKMHKLDPEERKVNQNDRYITENSYFTDLIFNNNGAVSQLNMLNGNHSGKDIRSFNVPDGIYSYFEQRYYPKSKEFKAFKVNLSNGNEMIVKVDPHWYDVNCFELNMKDCDYSKYSGMLFMTKEELEG